MKRIELRLVPVPGQKPEFLATLELVQKTAVPSLWEELPPLIVLEGYTRDAWATDTATTWTQWQVESVDGRNKLPGFVKYLRERQKTAFGKVGNQMWVISPKQMSSSTLNCRIAPMEQIPNCPFKPNTNDKSKRSSNSSSIGNPAIPPLHPNLTSVKPSTTTAAAAAPNKPKKSGLLGNLVGAQRRTNQQVQIATAIAPRKAPPTTTPEASNGLTTNRNNNSNDEHQQQNLQQQDIGSKTAGQVLAEFRQEMEQEMLDFDLSTEPCLKIKIDLAGKLRMLVDEDKQSGRVTMEVLKYIVYEQAEEVNEEWIAHKEPSEFMDEALISVYKEGEAPPDVLEDMNKAELPDEIRGQQRAIVEQRQKAEQIKAQKLRMEQTKLALQNKAKAKQQQEEEEEEAEEDDDLAALNTKKRDRRTIEDFEREAKRRRGE